jgi:hypothetical protein
MEAKSLSHHLCGAPQLVIVRRERGLKIRRQALVMTCDVYEIRDGFERVIDLVGDSRGEPPNRRQSLALKQAVGSVALSSIVPS